VVLDSDLQNSYSTHTLQLQIERFEILNSQRKVHPDQSSVTEVHICSNNQNRFSIVAARPYIDNSFFSRSSNCADFDDVSENWMFDQSNDFESELPFFIVILKICKTIRLISLREGMPPIGASR
jgi:hypothetical protein